MHLFLGSRSERGEAHRALTKRVKCNEQCKIFLGIEVVYLETQEKISVGFAISITLFLLLYFFTFYSVLESHFLQCLWLTADRLLFVI